MFISPDKENHKKYNTVPKYDVALALYFDALVFNFVFPIRKISMRNQTSTTWWASIASVVAIVMAHSDARTRIARILSDQILFHSNDDFTRFCFRLQISRFVCHLLPTNTST